MTGYEKIKNMTIDEMAKRFNDDGIMTDKICREVSICPYMDEDGNISDDFDCTGCIKTWLESEVSEDENNGND